MIITVTANPAVDVVYGLSGAVDGCGLNRAKEAAVFAGGKGINVSRAVLNCGGDVVTFALAGGYMGRLLSEKLDDEGIPLTVIPTACETRANVCAVSPEGDACEINAPGGPVTMAELAALTEAVLDRASEGDVVILSGSLPACSDGNASAYWASLIPKLKGKGCTVISDCSGEALRLAVNSDCPPDIIKPNLHELCELSKIDTNALSGGMDAQSEFFENTFRIAENASETIAKKGISVLATLGAVGSVFTPAEDPTTHIRCPAVPVSHVSNVKGAGDTFLGVFAYNRLILGREVNESLSSASHSAANHVAGN